MHMHMRIHMHFTPTHSAWLSQVERWFALATLGAIPRNAITGVRELKQQIKLFVQRDNTDATPFRWVAAANSILQKIERIGKRTSATGRQRTQRGLLLGRASWSD